MWWKKVGKCCRKKYIGKRGAQGNRVEDLFRNGRHPKLRGGKEPTGANYEKIFWGNPLVNAEPEF